MIWQILFVFAVLAGASNLMRWNRINQVNAGLRADGLCIAYLPMMEMLVVIASLEYIVGYLIGHFLF